MYLLIKWLELSQGQGQGKILLEFFRLNFPSPTSKISKTKTK